MELSMVLILLVALCVQRSRRCGWLRGRRCELVPDAGERCSTAHTASARRLGTATVISSGGCPARSEDATGCTGHETSGSAAALYRYAADGTIVVMAVVVTADAVFEDVIIIMIIIKIQVAVIVAFVSAIVGPILPNLGAFLPHFHLILQLAIHGLPVIDFIFQMIDVGLFFVAVATALRFSIHSFSGDVLGLVRHLRQLVLQERNRIVLASDLFHHLLLLDLCQFLHLFQFVFQCQEFFRVANILGGLIVALDLLVQIFRHFRQFLLQFQDQRLFTLQFDEGILQFFTNCSH
mmetsp:Transcript_11533/g.33152  ORF Transcript_11533/g.33152 Transcript_11533/m.33152 type:complete len:293 (-) Transcript_11533:2647-3525(-)